MVAFEELRNSKEIHISIMDKYIEPLLENYSNLRLELSVLVAVFVIIITIALFKLLHKKKFVGNTVLLMGVSDSGKTLIFTRLVYSKYAYTHTSMKENIGTFSLDGKSMRLVDIPGDVRIRQKFFDKYKSSMTGLVYVIDGVAAQKNGYIKTVAAYLHELLSDPSVRKLPILILCNKQDDEIAKKSILIRLLLETEMCTLDYIKFKKQINTESAVLSAAQKLEASRTCSQLIRKMEFADGFAFNNNLNALPDLDQLHKWLKKVA